MPAPSPNRLFQTGPLPDGGTVRLDADASHHALRVLRLRAGDPVELFDGSGPRWPGRLLDEDPRGASVALGAPVHAGTESPIALGLAQALPAGDRMDWVVEKAAELGATAIQPLFSRRSLLRLDGARAAKRLAHWRRIAVAACMQCGRDRVPAVLEPVPLDRWVVEPGDPGAPAAAARPVPAASRWLLSPHDGAAIGALGPVPAAAWLLVGPEGGLDDAEDARARAAGWRPLRLGPRVLRTETAGLAALAALQARFGDLG
ncbi:MAG: 16S rRNA (uracil(1498)-N(3))-methyltransferase [Burkholderiaceae bacterium]|nr:16S rRNA (uracil(1498)-N(3))-methyltransferase [Burkholderiales bacterium]MCZ8104471.1 16S rRNA (uracil(1498)-N(3))-methyltransferase [Burkholderiales bacterium]MCZ8337798.1 16S rRNA (uracil(1498)-N(3))-methyltransferase [Burkholderiaceae bacterium]